MSNKKHPDILHPSRLHDWATGALQLLVAQSIVGIQRQVWIDMQVSELQRRLREQERRDEDGPVLE